MQVTGFDRHPLGKTDMQVSRIGLGCHALGHVSVDQVRALVESALEGGMNVIDTAECYGESETLLGQALGTRRHACYLFTKCGHSNGLGLPDWSSGLIERSIERSLRRLQTDYLDLLQLHSCSREVLARGEVIGALQRAQQAGKVRYLGYSGDRCAASYAIECGAFAVLQTSVNLADQQAIDLLLPEARAHSMGVIVKRSLAGAAWRTSTQPTDPDHQFYWHRLRKLNYDFLTAPSPEIAQTALRFTLSIPEVDVALVGTTSPERLKQNLAVLAQGPLPSAQVEAIRARWRSVTWWRRLLPGGRLGWQGIT